MLLMGSFVVKNPISDLRLSSKCRFTKTGTNPIHSQYCIILRFQHNRNWKFWPRIMTSDIIYLPYSFGYCKLSLRGIIVDTSSDN